MLCSTCRIPGHRSLNCPCIVNLNIVKNDFESSKLVQIRAFEQASSTLKVTDDTPRNAIIPRTANPWIPFKRMEAKAEITPQSFGQIWDYSKITLEKTHIMAENDGWMSLKESFPSSSTVDIGFDSFSGCVLVLLTKTVCPKETISRLTKIISDIFSLEMRQQDLQITGGNEYVGLLNLFDSVESDDVHEEGEQSPLIKKTQKEIALAIEKNNAELKKLSLPEGVYISILTTQNSAFFTVFDGKDPIFSKTPFSVCSHTCLHIDFAKSKGSVGSTQFSLQNELSGDFFIGITTTNSFKISKFFLTEKNDSANMLTRNPCSTSVFDFSLIAESCFSFSPSWFGLKNNSVVYFHPLSTSFDFDISKAPLEISFMGFLQDKSSETIVGLAYRKQENANSPTQLINTLCLGQEKNYCFNFKRGCFSTTISNNNQIGLWVNVWHWIRYVIGFHGNQNTIRIQLYIDGKLAHTCSYSYTPNALFATQGYLGFFNRNSGTSSYYAFVRYRSARPLIHSTFVATAATTATAVSSSGSLSVIPPAPSAPEAEGPPKEAVYDVATTEFAFDTPWTYITDENKDEYIKNAMATKPLAICNNKHTLVRTTLPIIRAENSGYSGGYICDYCSARHNDEIEFAHCTPCSFDLCPKCVAEYKIFELIAKEQEPKS